MSDPTRYTPLLQCVEPSYQRQEIESKLTPLSDGEWIAYSDYARLKAEVERLKAGEQPTEWRHYKDGDTSK